MKQEAQFILEHAIGPAFLVDENGNLRHANAAARRIVGAVLEGVSPTLAAIWGAGNEETAGEFLARVAKTPASEVRIDLKLGEGTRGAFDAQVCALPGEGPKSFVFMLRRTEVTETKPAPPAEDSSQAQKQKLDCALQLARTVALDFNNALTVTLGHVSLILSKIEPDHPWRKSLMEVEKAAERAAEVAHDLASFSRQDKDVGSRIAGDVGDVLRRTVEAAQASAPTGIAWSIRLEPRLNTVVFDEAKLQQALLKILDNSVQAVGAAGSIHIETSNRDLDRPVTDGAITVAPGTYVCIEIADSGPGIPSQIMPRIFEPFFTTKQGHRGLGLAWVYGIVTNHGGSVAVTSAEGKGASVRLYFRPNAGSVANLRRRATS